MRSKPRVLVTHHQVQPVALALLRQHCDVIVPSADITTREEILGLCPAIDGLLWTSYKMKLDRQVLDACGAQLKVVSLTMNGVDCVDTRELTKRGIPLGHTPSIPNGAVADIAIGLMIAASTRFLAGEDASDYEANHPIEGSTVGIVGLGGIGQLVARRLQGFNVGSLIYCGHSAKDKVAQELNARFVTKEELLRCSDFVIICCPLTAETIGMFDHDAFASMRPNAVLVNVARGAIVDELSLVAALKSGQIRAAGLDTVTVEPVPPDSELFHLPNCVMVPHLGTATKKTRDAMAVRAVENLLAGLRGEPMPSQFVPFKQ
ncbi:glyoxylate reductase/hydroxypyruvate reductase-like [Anopheles albimanus]|uniref:glyoxylate reductase/hydroxypyruvate reductase-like n=1 Tax=Anopheles albimanus TaxID=7167 RepID=UPI00163F1E73|nr:glyoxylate reductase/hydroxypyruvate reductase-like [Anopheles albimanus]